MTTFAFTAIVSGLDINDGAQLDALFTERFVLQPSMVDGVTSIDVEIDAPSGEAALGVVLTHIAEVGLGVVRVLEDLVNVPEIAERLAVNRETVRTWVAGTRGPADFPPHRMVVGNQKLWTWSSVHAWADVNQRLPEAGPLPLDAACVDWLNGRLAPRPVADARPTIVIVGRQWAAGSWTSRAARLYTTSSAARVDESYAARDGVNWSYEWGKMEELRV
ncbi:hypothetical protein [Cellulomonas sp.]|uniref:helix-turn-helix transcriptional regulator n=1 Tax=Cellulomonas sp. TaxID=40001 RepID=UPI001B1FEE8E|nr:hypothetical protein [Cellulomonas sp.]MBO9555623.1 hypothetical protein [Cellulomonas sp.]